MSAGRVVVYRDGAGEYRWTDVIPSIGGRDETAADSGEGYVDRAYCEQRALIQAHGRPVWWRTPDGDEEIIDIGQATPTAAASATLALTLDDIAGRLAERLDDADQADARDVREAAHYLRQYAGRPT